MINNEKKKWLVILNPHAGSGRGKKDKEIILKRLDKRGLQFKLAVSDYPKHTIELVTKAINDGYRKIVGCGGDGTINEIVNGIFQQTACPFEEITVGVIPVGTGNDWVKTFGIPNDYKKSIEILLKAETMKQDIGKISFNENGQTRVCYFANMAGFGFDAMVAEKTNRLKNMGKSGLLLYLQALGSSFFKYHTSKTKITIDNEEIDELIFSTSIGIGKFNGGGMMQAPGAIPDNGSFQVTIIRKIGIFGILRNLAGLYSGEFVKDHRVSTFIAKHIAISADTNIAGEADGEILGDNKFEIEMHTQKLNVIYNPEKYLRFGS